MGFSKFEFRPIGFGT